MMLPGSSQVNRRTLLRKGAIAGTLPLAAIALACRPKPAAPASTSPSAPRRGGTINLSENFVRGFDPHVLQATDTGSFGLFYSTLVRANPKTNEVEPDLAAKWESPSQTELVFTLAPNTKWHDKPPANGRNLTAQDVIYSYQRIQSPDPKFINKSYLSGVDRMEAVDDHTVKITLKQPDVTQLGNLSVFSMKILAPEVVERAGKFATADTCVGTGAFVLQSSEINVGSSLIRNTNYFKPGLPYLDRINMKAFQDLESEWAAFLAGQLDYRWVPGQESQDFQKARANQFSVGWVGDQIYQIAQAMTVKKPWDDARVQRAMRLLIDHREYRDVWAVTWFGRGRYSSIFGTATADIWDLTEDEYGSHLEWTQPKDRAIKEALSLLSAAGYSKDKPLKFTLSGGSGNAFQQQLAELGQAQLQKNGQGVLDPQLKLYQDNAVWTSVRANGDFEYYIGGHSSGGTDPDTYFTSTYKTGGGRNYGKMSDPQLDAMFAKQRTIFDEQERKKAVRDIIVYMIDHCPYGSAVPYYILYATPPNVHGFPPQGPTFKWGDHYEGIWVNA
jgi:peptide/nickel transport system substrate-binding protein